MVPPRDGYRRHGEGGNRGGVARYARGVGCPLPAVDARILLLRKYPSPALRPPLRQSRTPTLTPHTPLSWPGLVAHSQTLPHISGSETPTPGVVACVVGGMGHRTRWMCPLPLVLPFQHSKPPIAACNSLAQTRTLFLPLDLPIPPPRLVLAPTHTLQQYFRLPMRACPRANRGRSAYPYAHIVGAGLPPTSHTRL